MISVGKFQTLNALRATPHGVYLSDEDKNEVLLPNSYVPDGFKLGGTISVFVYTDSEDRLIATTLKPKCQVDEFAYLKVKDVNRIGAFMDWGLVKDLLVPKSQQAFNLYPEQTVMVRVYLDSKSNRLAGSTKWQGFLAKEAPTYNENDTVDILVYEEADNGYKCVVDNNYLGMLYKNELFETITIGDKRKAYVNKVREDLKIDLRLIGNGYDAQIDTHSTIILEALNINNGFLRLNDKSDPLQIKALLGLSKKAFKKTIGTLYRQKIIDITEDGIELLQNPTQAD